MVMRASHLSCASRFPFDFISAGRFFLCVCFFSPLTRASKRQFFCITRRGKKSVFVLGERSIPGRAHMRNEPGVCVCRRVCVGVFIFFLLYFIFFPELLSGGSCWVTSPAAAHCFCCLCVRACVCVCFLGTTHTQDLAEPRV